MVIDFAVVVGGGGRGDVMVVVVIVGSSTSSFSFVHPQAAVINVSMETVSLHIGLILIIQKLNTNHEPKSLPFVIISSSNEL